MKTNLFLTIVFTCLIHVLFPTISCAHNDSLEYYFKALKLSNEVGDKKNIILNLNNIGLVYYHQGDYPKALLYNIKSWKLSNEIGNKKSVALNSNNIGLVYYHQGDYAKALEYLFKALEINEDVENKKEIATNKNIVKLETNHEKEVAEMERERNNEELKINNQKRERKNLLKFGGIVTLLSIIGLLVFFLYKLFLKRRSGNDL